MSLTRHAITLSILAGLVAACGPSVQASTAPLAPTTAASATLIPATPSPQASPSDQASPSVSAAACLDKAMFALLMGGKFNTMSAADMAALGQALEAYDFGGDATATKWRDFEVAALKKGDSYSAGLGMMQIVAGQVQLKSCP